MADIAPRMDLPAYVKQAELSPEEAAQRQLLVSFCLTLARAILQNSYYSPDHPQARKVAEEPFQQLKQLGAFWDEITFLNTSYQETESIALDGVYQEPVPLEVLIGGPAGEHFAGKLLSFSKRNRLVSFSIKNLIREDEFHRFIGVFVERHIDMDSLLRFDDRADEVRNQRRFTESLIEHNVVNVTIVLEDDLVDDRRRLPWRVKVAISRLRKDLRHIPLYSKSTDAELREAKIRLISDILRPLSKGIFLKQLMLNLDLIAEEVAEFHGLDLEPDLIDALPIDRQALLAEALLVEHERRARPSLQERGPEQRPDLEETIDRLLLLIGMRLAQHAEVQVADTLLRQLHDHGAVPLSCLPRAMQVQIRMDRWTSAFLRDTGSFLKLFDQVESPDAYLQHLPHIVAIIPNLIRIERYEDANRIIETLAAHRRTEGGFKGRSALVVEALGRLDQQEIVTMLVEAMETKPPEVRGAVGRLFLVMGAAAVAPLVRVIEQGDREDVCSDAAMALVRIGPEAVAPITALLETHKVGRRATRYLLKVLAELGGRDAGRTILAYARHPAGPVRAEALSTLARLFGDRAARALVPAMEDPDPDVASRAVHLVERVGLRDDDTILRLQALIRPTEAPPEAAQIAAVSALSRLGELELGDGTTAEDLMIEAFERFDQSKLTAFLYRGKEGPHDRVRIALCDGLVAVGGPQALTHLEDLSTESSPVVRERMKRAASELRARLG
ncbi:MAG: hypothetical protein AMXMBFR64_25620 [Myxococcales bacterium]